MKMLDLFSGIGGFHKGLVQAGIKIDWCGFSEIDKYATSVYKNHFPESEVLGNVRTINASIFPRIDILCGGFPCQAFSIAGKRKGFDDTRGTLFYEIARICEQIRPSIIFLENVRGLLSHGGGRIFETIIRTLGDLGYCVQWQVCNSRHFGVPQNRERVFIIGHLGKGSFRKIFPLRNGDEQNIQRTKQQSVNCICATYGKGIDNHGARTVVHSTQTRSADRPSLKYSSGGSGPLSKEDGTVYCIDTGNTQAVQLATRIRRLKLLSSANVFKATQTTGPNTDMKGKR
jgi:DNA-cytosine methyltransferase